MTEEVQNQNLVTIVTDKKILSKLRKAVGSRKLKVFDVGQVADDFHTYLVVTTKGKCYAVRFVNLESEFTPVEV